VYAGNHGIRSRGQIGSVNVRGQLIGEMPGRLIPNQTALGISMIIFLQEISERLAKLPTTALDSIWLA
jgi:hypothetical protein